MLWQALPSPNKPRMPVPDPTAGVRRLHIRVQGIVQGVGFRPFVYKLALRCGLGGHVGNDGSGVFIEVEGRSTDLATFLAALQDEAPPLSRIDALLSAELPVKSDLDFRIVSSAADSQPGTLISPDVSLCEDCLRELFAPDDRRFHYPFINCTNCGPRYTIIERLPYDRVSTTMSAFEMCPLCAEEYQNPLSRRFHAQPNACPTCGPQVWFQQTHPVNSDAVPIPEGEQALTAARMALARGEVLAIKGLGGFHLACDARNSGAVGLLRDRKGRADKPFAIMVRDLDAARAIAEVDQREVELLLRRERPIVLLRKKLDSELADNTAPGNPFVGVMLPYTPLHYLLFEQEGQGRPLVMTSGNRSGEPIVHDNAAALARLGPLVDGFLLHNRPIHVPCDDSVIAAWEEGQIPIRRSRGYTPSPLRLATAAPPLLAVGGELKNTFCLLKGQNAFLSQHIGDMANLETMETFARAVEHFCTLYAVRPEKLVCDLHPNYLTTQWAKQFAEETDVPLVQVQHHHAHIAALMGEHGLADTEQVIGVCYDGTGYGSDHTIWGGEFLITGRGGFRRAAHLKPIPLAGGDAAIRRPYRAALAYLWAAGLPWDDDLAPVRACSTTERQLLLRQFTTGFQAVPCSSMGRLFDATAALIGLRTEVTYEAQAAIELEGLLAVGSVLPPHMTSSYVLTLTRTPAGVWLMDPAPLLAAVVEDVRRGVPRAQISFQFHLAVAEATVQLCEEIGRAESCNRAALSGGVFQNRTLLQMITKKLHRAGFTVLVHRLVPPNDGGLAFGQAVLGASNPE